MQEDGVGLAPADRGPELVDDRRQRVVVEGGGAAMDDGEAAQRGARERPAADLGGGAAALEPGHGHRGDGAVALDGDDVRADDVVAQRGDREQEVRVGLEVGPGQAVPRVAEVVELGGRARDERARGGRRCGEDGHAAADATGGPGVRTWTGGQSGRGPQRIS